MSNEEKRVLGDNIRKKRKVLGLSQQEVAEKTEIAISTFRRIEQGCGNPSLESVIKIARCLKVDLNTLYPISGIDCDDESRENIQKICFKFNCLNKKKRKRIYLLMEILLDTLLS